MDAELLISETDQSLEENEGSVVPRSRRYWRVYPGGNASAWELFQARSVVAIELHGTTDLRPVIPANIQDIQGWLEGFEEMRGRRLFYIARQFWDFYHEMQLGDLVCAYGQGKVLGWGEIVGEYEFVEDDSGFPHRRAVHWYSVEAIPRDKLSSQLQSKLQMRQTIISLTEADFAEIQEPHSNYQAWLFSANARHYLVEAKLGDARVGDESEQAVRHPDGAPRYEPGLRPHSDNIGVLWQTGLGIVAAGRLVSEPESGAVKFRYTHILPNIIGLETLSSHPILGKMEVLRTQHPGSYPLTREEWTEIKKLLSRGENGSAGAGSPTQTRLDLMKALTRSLSALGLSFTDWQVATFFTALQVKGFVILSGISGTGKTKLAQHFAELLPQPLDPEGNNLLFVPVRPDWRDSKSLLGYYNPLTSTYEWTNFTRFLQRAWRSYRDGDGLAWFVILDEMNLAHVEYYFADMLSVLESGRDEEGYTRVPLRFHYPEDAEGDLPPREIRLPPNLYVVGTVNVDETTHAFSPKVLDRAFTLEFTEVGFSDYPPVGTGTDGVLADEERQAILNIFTRDGTFKRVDKPAIAAYVSTNGHVRYWLQNLNGLLQEHGLHFGYRVFDEIIAFLDAAEENGTFAELGGREAAFDAAVLMKVLPKFHGSRGKLEAPLKSVLAWCVNPAEPARTLIETQMTQVENGRMVSDKLSPSSMNYRCPVTAARVVRMLRALYTDGFAAFG